MVRGRVYYSIKETDIKALFNGLDKAIENNTIAIKKAVNKAGLKIESRAKQLITGWGAVDFGILKNSIMPNYSQTGMGVQVGTDITYAPYVEFGTGSLVQIPIGLESYASQFKGTGFKEVNLPARPFLFPAFTEVAPEFINDLEKNLI
jgi:HK97 gp10 family phage protein